MTTVRSTLRSFVLFAALGAAALSASFATADVELRLRSGQTWRGELNAQVSVVFVERGREQTIEGTLVRADTTMVVVETEAGGRTSRKTIFFGDLRSMRTLSEGAPPVVTAGADAASASEASSSSSAPGEASRPVLPGYHGVFVLPLEGVVGIGMRDEEIVAIGKEADKFGPGQIIILLIDSPGGFMIEAGKIHLVMKELRKRHRVVAWVKKAISAAAFTALHCDEMYFMTPGTLGSMTAFAGGTAVQGVELYAWLELAASVAAESGRDGNMALCMIQKDRESSVDIPDGGGPKDAIWRDDALGQIVVDSKDTMLCFNASGAFAVGVSDGTADTPEELARLLDLPGWIELSDAGRRMHADRQRIVKLAETELPKLAARYGFKGTGSGDPIVVLSNRIQVFEELIRWWDRCDGSCMEAGIPPKDYLRNEIERLRGELAQLRRNQRGGTGGTGR